MKYYLIAGEASGDLHAANLMRALKKEDAEADFRFFGGDLMQAIGGQLVKHYREMAYMGFIPVVLHLRTIFRNLERCREDISHYQPDVVILIDYPGFNLKIARFVKTELHLPVHYYISPKIWAWKQYRINAFRKYVDRMFCIFPFEPEFFSKLNYKVDYVGNPSVDSVSEFKQHYTESFTEFAHKHQLEKKPILALLSGSRRQEIKDNLPAMLEISTRYPQYQAVIAGAPGIDTDYYAKFTQDSQVRIVFGETYPLLQHSHVALVTSGTATLETALFRIPQLVCYYTPAGKLVSFVFRHFFHTPYISLVNLIAGKEIVQELFGAHFSKTAIEQELNRLIDDNVYRNNMQKGYDTVIRLLGKPGAASRTASLIFQALRKQTFPD